MRRFAIFAWIAFHGALLAAQTAQPPRFEVAAIRPTDPNPSNPMVIGMSADGSMVKYTNITLRDCIRGAFRVNDYQIVGPDWMTTSRFEIDARLPAGVSSDRIPDMLRTLLAERFKLEVRQETKEQEIYALTVAPGGAKLPPAQAMDPNSPKVLGPDGKPRDLMMYGFPPGGISLTAPSATLASVTGLLSRFMVRPVVDETGIQGRYSFKLIFEPEKNGNQMMAERAEPDAEPVPTLSDAVKQYGLRLDARRGPIEMITVTHLEKLPTEN